MAEEMVELGFEGLDRFADRHFDKTYDRLPAIPRTAKQKRKLEQRQREYLQKTHGQAPQDGPYPPRNHPENQPGNHPDKGYTSRSTAPESASGYNSDPEMYAPDSRQDRYGRDDGYREPEQNGYTAPGPGFKVPRGRDGPGDTRGMQVAPYEQQAQSEYGQQSLYGGGGVRPAPQRRGSSWSPPRSQRQGRSKSRRRRSNSRERDSSTDMKSRLLATVGGALVGGFAGNRATKGKKYDTVATIAGAIIGGVGAKEAAGHWDDRKRKKEQQRNGDWDDDSDDSKRRSDRRRDDRYERDDRRSDDRRSRYDYNDRYEGDDRRRY
ncbi:hypothetical protein AA0113_g2843 [Alternaria arborescens]|uniref:Glycine zipper 2TM domain-containing protein n=1 Tax=Alternaria arborescens TaxID=156630 RepID=A0A4Q4SJ35_9PLEO|nr:hypothetical protein AA0111_g8212 [Alternaria arborescens]RYN23861.1 hypothetical protein AA0112_g9291 [Alternaria arborescens]RYO26192.1 hypothetical protein AA0111_g8212 [Alternaria arborescens]RYO70675.1 hypothetical protein AA0113_g2843 [Alternaria arborescens]